MKILLTGARGMVGRNVLEHARIAQFEVLAPTSAELDLRDYAATYCYFVRHRPDVVIHAAGKVGGIQANMREPVSFLVDNLDMGRNIVLAAHATGTKRLLNIGSSCMYPRGCADALREDMILQGAPEPTNEGYALAKITTARLCGYVMREDPEVRYKTLIPCNLYGRWDKFDPERSHLVPAIIHKMHKAITAGREAVEIWGDGEARREFMYAGDLADAIVCAVERFDTLPDLMNVGLGVDHSINDYYAVVAEVMGYAGGFTHDLARPVGMARKLVDVSRQTDWSWTPTHSLKEGIAKTHSFYLEQLS